MPQLDPSTYLSQIFWLFACFSTVLVFSLYVTLPRLKKILEARYQRIEGAKETAETLKKQAENLEKAFQEHLEEARKEAQGEILKENQALSLKTEKAKQEISEKFKKTFLSEQERLESQK